MKLGARRYSLNLEKYISWFNNTFKYLFLNYTVKEVCMNKFFAATFTLSGAIIGAGIFGIPYVAARAGFWTAMLALFVIGLALLILNLYVGEISLRTKTKHQLVGYAQKYLGVHGKNLMIIAIAVSCYSAIIAYTIGVSQSLVDVFGGSQFFWALGFYFLMMVILYGDLLILARSEFYFEIIKFVIIAVLLFFLFTYSGFDPYSLSGFSFFWVLYPAGVILFACVGLTSIPLIKEILDDKKQLFGAIILGYAIPVIVYILFTAGTLGVTGGFSTEVATIGLASVLGFPASWILHIFAILAMASSFVALGYVLKWTFMEDLRIHKVDSWALTVLVPPIFLLLGVNSFFRVIDIGGSISTSIIGILVVLMHHHAKKFGDRKPEYSIKTNYLVYLFIIALLVIALTHTLFSFV